MNTPGLQFTLRTLTHSDILACAHIAGLAFAHDRQTQFKAANPTNPYDHVEGMKAAPEDWLNRPPGSVEKTLAIEDATQEVMGWVAWSFRGFGSEERLTTELDIESVRGAAPLPNPALLNDSSRSSRERLETYTYNDLQTFMQSIMPAGTLYRIYIISSIVVHPSHQGKGVGKALARKGTDRADVEGVCAWVHASETGLRVFEKCGFEEIRRLELDLDEWNSEGLVPPEGEGEMWGTYVLRYMLREPLVK